MTSLRARLIAVLLLVAAAGLLVLAGVTYAEQRSFLSDRVDEQLQTALPAMEHQLDENAGGRDPFDEGRSERGAGREPGGRPPPANVSLPPGTYGVRRDASGQATGEPVVISYGQPEPAPPDLPAELPAGRAVTVGARGDEDLRYRVRAVPERGGGTIVAAVPLVESDETLARLLRVEGVVIGGVLIVLGLVAALLVRLSLRPLERIGTTAGIIAGGELSRRVSPATQKTEVGRLGLALNAMLDRLEDAFAKRKESEDRLRRFLADASHELRTPLASIRGYAEIFRMGAAREPAELERSMRRIEDEAARMGVLVEDLLTLARLDEVRDAVREPVDLAALARDAVDDARTAAPDRAIALDAGPDITVLADADQLRQVLANLLSNALVHTPAGTPIEIKVTRERDSVRMDVRDHGAGLPGGDPRALFDRFWRAEAGRERGKAGAGLGLAIVAGIVEAHDGRVQAVDAPGGGACFTVVFPAGAPAAAPSLAR
ncbi:MAG TPA: HAMP domain-containing sensor histidine kinase [Solirubrobacteraceae bacterium]|nr:HAMP domain-containing sensor histidine kinase [Solirubrobacteraceae bacterium]